MLRNANPGHLPHKLIDPRGIPNELYMAINPIACGLCDSGNFIWASPAINLHEGGHPHLSVGEA
jgi:hypothetical protein